MAWPRAEEIGAKGRWVELEGTGLDTVFVRTTAQPYDEIETALGGLGVSHVQPVDPAASLEMLEGVRLDAGVGQRIAPAIGAAVGRS